MGKHNLLGTGNNICKFLSYCNKNKDALYCHNSREM